MPNGAESSRDPPSGAHLGAITQGSPPLPLPYSSPHRPAQLTDSLLPANLQSPPNVRGSARGWLPRAFKISDPLASPLDLFRLQK